MSNILQVAREARAAMVAARTYVPEEVAIKNAVMFDPWNPNGVNYTAKTDAAPADIVRGADGILYRCIGAHTSQASWSPEVSPSLWVRIDDPEIEWPEWRQPTGATDAYAKDAKVTHNGKRWVSGIEANTYEPGGEGIGENIWKEFVEKVG